MKQLLTLIAILSISAPIAFAQNAKESSLKLHNTTTTFTKEGIDIALSYPQIITSDDMPEKAKQASSIINSEVCRTLASLAPATDEIAKDSLWQKATSPELLEIYAISSARGLLTEMKGFGGSEGYDLYSEWSAFSNDHLASIFIKTYIYTGGAHGITVGRILNYDRTNGNHIDIISEVKDTAFLMDLAAIYFCKERHLKKNAIKLNTGLFFELADLPLPDQIGFTAKGMVLYYDPYSIAAYSFGPIAITIPYKELQDVLTTDFIKMKVTTGGGKSYNEKSRAKNINNKE